MNTSTLSAATVAAPSPAPRSLRTPRRILAPVDFSKNSLAGLKYGAALAEGLGASLSLVHVTEPALPPMDGAWICPDAEQQESARVRLAELRREFLDQVPGDRLTTEVRLGSAPDEICEAARSQQTDLMVLSTHGYTGLKQVFLGGITNTIVRQAPCPVLVIPSHSENEAARHWLGWRSLLVPVDFSPRAECAVAYAGRLAQWSGGRVSLIHVLTFSEWDDAGACTGGDFAALSADVHARLTALRERMLPPEVHGETHVGRGAPFAQIVAGANSCDAELIVLTTQGRTGLAHLFLGSTAERVLHHASTPVLILPPGAE